MRKTSLLIGIFLMVLTALIISACSQQVILEPSLIPTQIPKEPVVYVVSKEGIGNYMVDSSGMTLYCASMDTSLGSNSSGDILKSWPVFDAGSIITRLSSETNALEYRAFTGNIRSDGTPQTAYFGYPLHYSAFDKTQGDTLGDGVNGKWFVVKVPFYTIMLRTSADLGTYLVDARGVTLYYCTDDEHGKNIISADEATQFGFIFYEENIIVPSALKATDFGIVTRQNGAQQTTFKGWPLYLRANYSLYQAFTDGQNSKWRIAIPDEMPP